MRMNKRILMGYTHQIKGYRIWIPKSRHIIKIISVSFDEGFDTNEQEKLRTLRSR